MKRGISTLLLSCLAVASCNRPTAPGAAAKIPAADPVGAPAPPPTKSPPTALEKLDGKWITNVNIERPDGYSVWLTFRTTDGHRTLDIRKQFFSIEVDPRKRKEDVFVYATVTMPDPGTLKIDCKDPEWSGEWQMILLDKSLALNKGLKLLQFERAKDEK
jgi:hypothetical protein